MALEGSFSQASGFNTTTTRATSLDAAAGATRTMVMSKSLAIRMSSKRPNAWHVIREYIAMEAAMEPSLYLWRCSLFDKPLLGYLSTG
jgi:hypothetical protein